MMGAIKKCMVISVILAMSLIPASAQNASFFTTIRSGAGTSVPYCIPWVDSGIRAGTTASGGNYIEVFPETQYQTVMGWGGTIQEKQWTAMQVLSAAGKDSIMRALFDTSGCNISFLRCPIGCCDFDINEAPISLNETSGDYTMSKFSLHRDSTRKIPLIKMAQAINPNLRFWGCPWSPPRWMHDNGDYASGTMKSDAQTLTAYALYLEKYIQGYKEAGINVEWICCQNEPTINDGGYPKCGWSNSLELNFYKNYMIPLFQKDNISARIFLGVFCCGTYADWITYFMNDATVKSFVSITSHSYQNPDWGLTSYTDYPTIPFFESEAPFHWPEDGIQDWTRGIEEYDNVSAFMANRAAVYTMWNMVNDQTGKSGFNWAQNVMIQVNSSTKQVTYNPHYWAYKHYCHFVKPGAKVVKHSGTTPGNTNAFRNPNGDVIVVLRNSNGSAAPIAVKVGAMQYKAVLPANSFNTLKIMIGTSTGKKNATEHQIVKSIKSKPRLSMTKLYVPILSADGIREIDVTLTDLAGRTVWSTRRQADVFAGNQQVFLINTPGGRLNAGPYLLSIKTRTIAGKATIMKNVVIADR